MESPKTINENSYDQDHLVEKISFLVEQKKNTQTCIDLLKDNAFLKDQEKVLQGLTGTVEKIDQEIKVALKDKIENLESKKTDIDACINVMKNAPKYHGADVVLTELYYRHGEIDDELNKLKSLSEKK